jgi:glycosyltransferase involved in cell wall biosynthesis
MTMTGSDRTTASGARVKVLLSTFNGAPFLRELLDSLLTQSYKNVHIDVRDDGSIDDTNCILDEYTARHPTIHTVRGENLGVIGSYFSLLNEAGDDFDFYSFCDQDDIWHPDKIRDAVTRLSSEDSDRPLLYCSRVEFVDEAMNRLGFSPIPRRIGFGNALVENIAIGCTVVVNRKARELILSREPGRMIMHDWWFYLIVSALGEVIYDEKPNIRYRQHSGNVIGGTPNMAVNVFRRLKVFMQAGKKLFMVSDQASEFENRYGPFLDRDGKMLLSRFIGSKKSLLSRFRYSVTMDVWRQSVIDTCMLRVLILLGWY